MKDLIKLSRLFVIFALFVFFILFVFSFNLFIKTDWRLALFFCLSASALFTLDLISNLSLVFSRAKIIQKDRNFYILQKSQNLTQVLDLLFFSKFLILLKVERKFLPYAPIWIDSVSKKDWHWLKVNLKDRSFFKF